MSTVLKYEGRPCGRCGGTVRYSSNGHCVNFDCNHGPRKPREAKTVTLEASEIRWLQETSNVAHQHFGVSFADDFAKRVSEYAITKYRKMINKRKRRGTSLSDN